MVVYDVKRIALWALAAVVVMMLALSPHATAAAWGASGAGDNLIVNGSFETTDGTNPSGWATHTWGGAMACVNNSQAVVTDCNFAMNFADQIWGGALFTCESDVTLTGCTFVGNRCEDEGGGVCCHSSSPTVIRCSFSGNSASTGMAVASLPIVRPWTPCG